LNDIAAPGAMRSPQTIAIADLGADGTVDVT
jgi:hypothetical protein